jgi:hypothetical protein
MSKVFRSGAILRLSRCNTHILSNFFHPPLANPLPVEFWLSGVSRTPGLTCAKLRHFFRELPHHQRLRTAMTLDLRECSSQMRWRQMQRYFRTVGSPRALLQRGIRLFSLVFLSGCLGFFLNSVKQHPQTTVQSGNGADGYISVTVCEWLLVLCVRMGVHKGGVRLRDLVGGRWATPIAVMKDIALGAVGSVDPLNESSGSGWREK